MADATISVHTPPAPIFALLSHPPEYERFVVGNSSIRGFDLEWPAEGALFHHSLGIKPLVIKDSTMSLATDGATLLVLLTKMGFLGATITTFRLLPGDGATELEIREEPMWGAAAWVWSKLVDQVLDWRNRRLLNRLKKLAESRYAQEASMSLPSGEAPAQSPTGHQRRYPTPSAG